MTNAETHNGTVHRAYEMKVGNRTLLSPTCRKYRIEELLATYPTDREVTCKRCQAKVEA